jgi:hypothetical protein
MAKQYKQNANWSLIKQQLHVRYAKSYLFAGLYNLAGETYIKAHQTKNNVTLYLKGIVFKLTPNIVWQLLQSTKRMLFSS